MNRFALAMMLTAGCAKPSSDPPAITPDPMSAPASSAASAAGAGGSEAAGGAGGHDNGSASANGAGGIGGSGGGDEPANQASSSASASSAEHGASASVSSGGPAPVDCSDAPMNAPCDSGLCALDGECRPLARCRVNLLNKESVVECLDPRVQHIRITHFGPPFDVSYPGCRADSEGRRYDFITCVPGDDCTVHMLIVGVGDYDAKGWCE